MGLDQKEKLTLMRKTLRCRASQIDNPGARDCRGCPYLDETMNCDDLQIMADALELIDELDIFRTTFSEAMDKGYTIKLCRDVTEEDENVTEE